MPVSDPAPLPQYWSEDVLRFWFETMIEEQWWSSTPELDELIRQRFLTVARTVAAHDVSQLTATPQMSLASVIALDQFPRNMFRRMPAAFATDATAVRVAEAAIAQGHDAALTVVQRSFLYMPFMHAEDVARQARSVALFTALGREENLKAAHEHKAIIDRFGRFPYRNATLGRADTPEEAAYLTGQIKRFGQ